MLPHLSQLVQAIDAHTSGIHQIFQTQFQTLAGWQSYWSPRANAISPIFQKPGSSWSAADFQALYIACWLYQPLEKGSFMIPIPHVQQQRLTDAMAKLPSRWSSHLSEKNARSAGQNYNFLTGYSELLVQFESERGSPSRSLFLKTEGHGSLSLAHLSSYITKSRTGKGNTASAALHNLATQNQFGIKERAAENYEKPYEELLKYLKLPKAVCTAEDAILTIFRKLKTKATPIYDVVIDEIELGIFVGARISKVQLATLVTAVIVPTINQPGLRQGKFITAVKKAETALLGLAECLVDDALDVTVAEVPRVFHEVRVTLEVLDTTVRDFIAEINNWNIL
jgi:hypothetical protein